MGKKLFIVIFTITFIGYLVTNKLFASEVSSHTTVDTYNSTSIKTPIASTFSNSTALLQNATVEKETSNNPLGLLLETIYLTQGENNAELWRLKAEAANVAGEGNHIFVDIPNLVYIVPPDNKELHITSDKGDIDQSSQILQFINKVNATYMNSMMTTDLLIYNGSTKTMTLPKGGYFSSAQTNGSASHVVWHLDSRILEAEGDVDILFSSTPKKAEENTSSKGLGLVTSSFNATLQK